MSLGRAGKAPENRTHQQPLNYFEGKVRFSETALKSKFIYTGILVADLERSIAFYKKALGMKLLFKTRIKETGGRVVWLVTKGSKQILELNWYPKRYRYGGRSGLDHLAFEVKDARLAYKKLSSRRRGVIPPFVEETTAGGRWILICPNIIDINKLGKVRYTGKPSKDKDAWELDIDPALSYAYDKRLRFGVLHRFKDQGWVADLPPDSEEGSHFEKLFGRISRSDPVKYASLREAYSYVSQPVPKISEERLNLREVGSEEDYYNAFLVSRLAKLPLNRTYRSDLSVITSLSTHL